MVIYRAYLLLLGTTCAIGAGCRGGFLEREGSLGEPCTLETSPCAPELVCDNNVCVSPGQPPPNASIGPGGHTNANDNASSNTNGNANDNASSNTNGNANDNASSNTNGNSNDNFDIAPSCTSNLECDSVCIDGSCTGLAAQGEGCDEDADCDVGLVCPDAVCVSAEECGNGFVEGAEACDDGDLRNGDGCDEACAVEPGWSCRIGEPSVCGRSIAPQLTTVPAATFQMGSPTTEEGRESDESQHSVTLTTDVQIQNVEVTQQQFSTLMGFNPSHHGPSGAGQDCGDNCPVENISWFDAIAYTNERSITETLPACFVFSNVVCTDGSNLGTSYLACASAGGIASATVTLNDVTDVYDCQGYRLPTEAEWEAAARASSAAATYNAVAPHLGELAGKLACESPHETLDPIAWFCGNSDATRPVASVPGGAAENALGLYDVLGNVSEWTWDQFVAYGGAVTDPATSGVGVLHVARGGGCLDPASALRAADRTSHAPTFRDRTLGFRVARTVPTPPVPFSITGATGGTDTVPDAQLSDGTMVVANWTDSANETGYEVTIYESDGVTVRCPTVNVSADTTSYEFSGCVLVAGSSYAISVVALRGELSSAASNEGFAFTVANPPTCGGESVGGYCWYLGARDEACSSVCSTRNGTDAAGALWAGSDAPSPNNCNNVLTALEGEPGTTVDFGCSVGWGCAIRSDFIGGRFRNRCVDEPTDPDLGTLLISRACACNE